VARKGKKGTTNLRLSDSLGNFERKEASATLSKKPGGSLLYSEQFVGGSQVETGHLNMVSWTESVVESKSCKFLCGGIAEIRIMGRKTKTPSCQTKREGRRGIINLKKIMTK